MTNNAASVAKRPIDMPGSGKKIGHVGVVTRTLVHDLLIPCPWKHQQKQACRRPMDADTRRRGKLLSKPFADLDALNGVVRMSDNPPHDTLGDNWALG